MVAERVTVVDVDVAAMPDNRSMRITNVEADVMSLPDNRSMRISLVEVDVMISDQANARSSMVIV